MAGSGRLFFQADSGLLANCCTVGTGFLGTEGAAEDVAAHEQKGKVWAVVLCHSRPMFEIA